MVKIVGPGSLIIDITGYAPHLPVGGETTLGTSIKLGPGGKGNNQMTAAHRAGGEVVCISAVGDDFLREIMLSHYAKEKMTTEYIKQVNGVDTGAAFIEVDEGTAQNRIIVVKGASETLTKEDILKAEKEFADADAIITQLETTDAAVLATKELAKKYHKPFVLNPAPFQAIPDGLFEGIDYVTPNETEAAFFTGVSVDNDEGARQAAEKFLAMGVKNVVITLGSHGVYFYNGEKEIRLPSLHVNAVDTTGAGDAFNGGFVTALAEGRPIEEVLKFATCTAAISVTRKGTAPAMPTREEIDALMKKEYGI